MSLTIKVVGALIVVAALAWAFFAWQKPAEPSMQGSTATSRQPTQPTKQASESGPSGVSSSGSSDASLSADLSAIDTQLQSANNASASVDEGLNDKPVAQTE